MFETRDKRRRTDLDLFVLALVAAMKAAEALRININSTTRRPSVFGMTFAELADHYMAKELHVDQDETRKSKAYSTIEEKPPLSPTVDCSEVGIGHHQRDGTDSHRRLAKATRP